MLASNDLVSLALSLLQVETQNEKFLIVAYALVIVALGILLCDIYPK